MSKDVVQTQLHMYCLVCAHACVPNAYLLSDVPHFAFMCVCAPCPSSYEVHCETESATNPVVEAAQVQQAVNPYLNPLFSSGSDQQLWTQIHSSLDPVICPLHVFVKAPAISNPIGVNTPPRQRSPWCILPSNRYLQLQKEVGSRKFLQI